MNLCTDNCASYWTSFKLSLHKKKKKKSSGTFQFLVFEYQTPQKQPYLGVSINTYVSEK